MSTGSPVVPSLVELTFDKEQLSQRNLGSGSFLPLPLGRGGGLIVRSLLPTAHDLDTHGSEKHGTAFCPDRGTGAGLAA